MLFWIFITYNFISKLHGYSEGNFPQVCDSMRPLHRSNGVEIPPQTSEPPFMVSYQLGRNIGDPIKVSLKSKDTFKFKGFMLEARDLSLDGDGPPLGKFKIIDCIQSRLLKCGDSEDSAVSNRLNVDKTLIEVNWTAEGAEQDIMFRATFSQTFSKYWERVTVTVLRPTSTPQPEPTTPATTTTTTPATTTTTPATTTTTPATITTQMSTTIPAITEIQGNTTNGTILTKLAAVSTTCGSGVSVVMMQTINNIMEVYPKTSSRHYVKAKFMIVGSLLSFLSSLSTLIIFCIDRPPEGNLIGLVIPVVVMSFTELVIALMQFGPSHELKGPCDLTLHVCFVSHHLFTNAFLYVTVINLIDKGRGTRRDFFLLIVHTVLTGLTIVCHVVIFAFLRKVTDKPKRRWGHRRIKEPLSAVRVFVIFISAFLMVGIIALSVAITVELFLIQND